MNGCKRAIDWQQRFVMGLFLVILAAGSPAGADVYDQFNRLQRQIPQQPGTAAAAVNQAVVRTAQGTVTTKAKSGPSWQTAQVGGGLGAGDSIRTGPIGSAAELGFLDGSTVRLGYSTTLTLGEGPRRSVRLLLGKLWSKVFRTGNMGLSVHTPAAVASIVGTELSVHVDPSRATTVSVTAGSVVVTANNGKKVTVTAGAFTRVAMGSSPSAPKDLKFLKDTDTGSGLVIDPRVAIVNPGQGAQIRGRQVIEVLVEPGGKQVEYVEFSVDGQVQYMANIPPYRLNLDTHSLSDGDHVLQAIARWADKESTISREVRIHVENGRSIAPLASPAVPGLPTPGSQI